MYTTTRAPSSKQAHGISHRPPLMQSAQSTPITPVIQRKSGCACGGSCPSCQDEDQKLQRKLAVGRTDDAYEQEADRVAETVMRMPTNALQRTPQKAEEEEKLDPVMRKPMEIAPHLQRSVKTANKQGEEPEEEIQSKTDTGNLSTVTPVTNARIQSLKRGGHVLPPDTQKFFESRMGYDFGHVRIHNSHEAGNISRGINAKAFTTGNHIAFSDGQYAPETQAGKKLLAHELTHVVQQSSQAKIQRKPLSISQHNQTSVIQRAVSKELSEIESLLSYGIVDWAITDAEAIQALELLKKLPRYQQAVFVSGDTYAGRLRSNLPDERVAEYAAIVSSVAGIAPDSAKATIQKIQSLLSYGILDWAITDAEAIQALDLLKGLSPAEQSVALGTIDYGRLMDNLPDDRRQELVDLLSQHMATGASRDSEEKAHPGSVLRNITFTSDHGVMTDNNKTWAPGGSPFAQPEWSRDPQDKIISRPLTHSMGKTIKAKLDIDVVPPNADNAPVRLRGESPSGFLSFDHIGTMQGGLNTTPVISSTAALPAEVKHYQQEEVVWKLKWRDWDHEIGRTRHELFATLDNPLTPSEVTLKRMLMAIGIVEPLQTTAPHEIVEGIMKNWNRYNLNIPLSATGWEWTDNFTEGAQCIDIVRFVKGVLNMIGSPGLVEAIVVWAKPDAPGTPIEELWTDSGCMARDSVGGWAPGMISCALHKPQYGGVGLIDGDWKLNAFEAALRFDHSGSLAYYPGGVEGVLKSPEEVLNVFKCLARFTQVSDKECKIEEVYQDYKYGPCPPGAVKKCWY